MSFKTKTTVMRFNAFVSFILVFITLENCLAEQDYWRNYRQWNQGRYRSTPLNTRPTTTARSTNSRRIKTTTTTTTSRPIVRRTTTTPTFRPTTTFTTTTTLPDYYNRSDTNYVKKRSSASNSAIIFPTDDSKPKNPVSTRAINTKPNTVSEVGLVFSCLAMC